MTTPALLSVYLDDEHVGTLYSTSPLAFEYDAAWLASPYARAIDVTIPLQTGKIDSACVYAFFENLLPEGDQRRIISLRHQVTSVFGLLAAVGGDTAGAVVLVPFGERPQAADYRSTTWEQLQNQTAHVDADADNAHADTNSSRRLSLSGAQFKILVSIDENGMPLLPLGNSPSTHILKPDIVRSDLKIFASAINETVMMRTALYCGLPTASVHYVSSLHACAVKRYDRALLENGRLIRVAQADLCQLAGKPSEVKYEIDGGPGFVECFQLISRYSVMPAVDQRNLLKWLFFNLFTGNNDSHAKNLALLHTHSSLRLAPFYDLMCTRLYSGLGRHFAFQIGGEYEPGNLQASHFETLAAELGIRFDYLKKIADELAKVLPGALNKACLELSQDLTSSERTLIERLKQKTNSLTKQIHAKLNA